jgi:hypothetical protein
VLEKGTGTVHGNARNSSEYGFSRGWLWSLGMLRIWWPVSSDGKLPPTRELDEPAGRIRAAVAPEDDDSLINDTQNKSSNRVLAQRARAFYSLDHQDGKGGVRPETSELRPESSAHKGLLEICDRLPLDERPSTDVVVANVKRRHRDAGTQLLEHDRNAAPGFMEVYDDRRHARHAESIVPNTPWPKVALLASSQREEA